MQFAQGMGCNRNGKQEEVNVVFNMNKKGNIVKAMKGEAVCTRINKEEK